MNNKKKLVFFINSLDGGGAEKVVVTILNHLSDKYQCHLILMDDIILYSLDKKINIITLSRKFIFLEFINIIKYYDFDHIISCLHKANYINVLASQVTKHKTILIETTTVSSLYQHSFIKNQVHSFLIKWLYNKANSVIPVSYGILKDLKKVYLVKTLNKVIYNPHPIEDIKKLSQAPMYTKFNKEKTLITIGSLIDLKKQSMIIKAFAKLPSDYHLIILGKGPLEDSLKELSKKLRIDKRILFIGFVSNPFQYLNQASIFILTSETEGFPNALIEAMICGCCIISTDCPSGPREILAPNTYYQKKELKKIEVAEYGLLIPLNNIEKLVEAIFYLQNNSKIKKKFAKKAVKRGMMFNLDLIEKYEEVLYEIVK